MWIRLSLAPLWVRILAFVISAALTAGLFTAITWYQDGRLDLGLIGALVCGVGGAAIGSTVAVGQANQRCGRVLADVDLPSTRAAAIKAAVSGPIPTDPVVRHIAAVLAMIRAQAINQHARRQIISGAWVSAIMAALSIWALADGHPRRAVFTAVLTLWFGASAAYTHWSRRRAFQRHSVLANPDRPSAVV